MHVFLVFLQGSRECLDLLLAVVLQDAMTTLHLTTEVSIVVWVCMVEIISLHGLLARNHFYDVPI